MEVVFAAHQGIGSHFGNASVVEQVEHVAHQICLRTELAIPAHYIGPQLFVFVPLGAVEDAQGPDRQQHQLQRQRLRQLLASCPRLPRYVEYELLVEDVFGLVARAVGVAFGAAAQQLLFRERVQSAQVPVVSLRVRSDETLDPMAFAGAVGHPNLRPERTRPLIHPALHLMQIFVVDVPLDILPMDFAREFLVDEFE